MPTDVDLPVVHNIEAKQFEIALAPSFPSRPLRLCGEHIRVRPRESGLS